MNNTSNMILDYAMNLIGNVLDIEDEDIFITEGVIDGRKVQNKFVFSIDNSSQVSLVIKQDLTGNYSNILNARTFVGCVIKAIEDLYGLSEMMNLKRDIHSEFKELVKRISIPLYLNELYDYSSSGLARTISHDVKIDYGRLIRELIKWGNATIEGKKITTGIIIAESTRDLFWSLLGKGRFIPLEQKVNLFKFNEIKALLEIVDGKNSYLIVEPINDELIVYGIFFSVKPILTEFNFTDTKGLIAPVFSVDPLGIRIGRGKQLILEFINGMPKIKKYVGFSRKLENTLNRTPKNSIKRLKLDKSITKEDAQNLTRLLLELSRYGKGASLVFGFDKEKHMDTVEQPNWIQPIPLPLGWGNNKKSDNDFIGMDILSNISKTDGAVLIDRNFNIVAFGAILKASPKKAGINGGSRHKSMASYTANKKEILGIVISSDGPISLIEQNKCIFHL
ncbi:hypothetical protein bcgnr5369_54200 [Bacillus cereus]